MRARRPSAGQLTALSLYAPLASPADLDRLAERVERGVARHRRLTHLAVAAAAILCTINLLTTGAERELTFAQRWWSIIPCLALATGLMILGLRARVLRPRAVAAQRRLLDQRRLDLRLAEIHQVEERVERQLAGLSPRLRSLEELHASGRATAARLAAEGGGGEVAEGRLEVLALVLDSYRTALANFEVDILLVPGFLRSPQAAAALAAAADLLRLGGPPAASAVAGQPPVPGPERPSIAVLPFADLSPEGDQEYFANGLAAELINALTRIEGLKVIARTSAFHFDGEVRDVREVGRRLEVATVLEGSVRRAGRQLRIQVELLRAADAVLLFSERYDRDMDDIFAVQDEIAAAIVRELRQGLLPATEPARAGRRTRDLEAYHLYLKGRHFWSRRTASDLQDSVRCFEQALARDPDYALAWAGLADSLELLGYYGVTAPREVFPRAQEAAGRALVLDDRLAEAHCSLAFAKLLYDWDFPGAEREFARTFELNPGYATAHHWFAEHLAFLGRHDDAIAQARTALALDPLSAIINTLLGWTFYYARRPDEAVAQLREALELAPEFAPALFWLGLACEQLGRLDEAAEALAAAVTHSRRGPMMLAALARLEARRGNQERAAELLSELEGAAGSGYVPAYSIATVHAARADRRGALDWLERAAEERDSWMVFLAIDPVWDACHADPRFRALLARVGLPPARGER